MLRWIRPLFVTFTIFFAVACGDDAIEKTDSGSDPATSPDETSDEAPGGTPSCRELDTFACSRAATCADEAGAFIIAYGEAATIEYESESQCGIFPPFGSERCAEATEEELTLCAAALQETACEGNEFGLPEACLW